jgi:hypothetical protein
MKRIAKRDTGNFAVELFDDGEEFVFHIVFHGAWGSDAVAVVHDEVFNTRVSEAATANTDKAYRDAAKKLLKLYTVGDLDVQELLLRNHFDEFGNPR